MNNSNTEKPTLIKKLGIDVTRKSPLTGKFSTLTIEATAEQIAEYNDPSCRKLIQQIFPNISSDEREFIKTGYTKEDWATIFPPDETGPEGCVR